MSYLLMDCEKNYCCLPMPFCCVERCFNIVLFTRIAMWEPRGQCMLILQKWLAIFPVCRFLSWAVLVTLTQLNTFLALVFARFKHEIQIIVDTRAEIYSHFCNCFHWLIIHKLDYALVCIIQSAHCQYK